jgi:phosphate-selective porin OprO/OprP
MLALALAAPLGAQEEQGQSSQAGEEQQEEEKKPSEPFVRIYWDEGLRIAGLRKNFTVKVGGLVQNDTAFFSTPSDKESELGKLDNGLEWRRVRLYAEGVFARFFEYKLMYDFAANNPPRLKDAVLSYRFPFAPIRVQGGRFRTRLSLEGGTSAINTTFMERGLLSAFVPSRNTGFLFLGDREDLNRHLWWAIGLVQKETQFDISGNGGFGVSGRLAYAWRDQETLDLVHLGANVFTRPADESIRFLERPESHLAPIIVDTGDMDATDSRTFIVEAAMVRGPFSLQTELATTYVDTTETDNLRFNTFYAYASYFLTGESRRYDSRRASFGAVRPRRTFTDFTDSYGAVEIAFRYSHLDLDDKEISGGILNDFTAAVNWYPNNHARVMANLIRAQRSGLDGIWIFEIRLQWAY